MGLVLGMVYKDILEFHRCALAVFRKSSKYDFGKRSLAATSVQSCIILIIND